MASAETARYEQVLAETGQRRDRQQHSRMPRLYSRSARWFRSLGLQLLVLSLALGWLIVHQLKGAKDGFLSMEEACEQFVYVSMELIVVFCCAGFGLWLCNRGVFRPAIKKRRWSKQR
ncbi:MAG: hypothetical protein Q8Q20_03345 [bacterium]|nr:hypothetical protein [bacterium]